MRTLRLTLTTFASISLLLAGCGSSDSSTPSDNATGAGTGGAAGSGGTGTGGSSAGGHTTGAGGSTGGHTTGGSGGAITGAGGHTTGTGGGGATGTGGKATGGGGSAGAGGDTAGAGGSTGGTGGGAGGSVGGTGGGSGGAISCSGGQTATGPTGLPAVHFADDNALDTTSSGYVITYTFDTMTTATVHATKLDGTMAQTVVTGAVEVLMFRDRDAVFFWTEPDATNKTGKLGIWTAANGPKTLVDSGAPLPPAAATSGAQSEVAFSSADNTTIVYAANSGASAGKSADLIRADIDGSNPVTIATTDLSDQNKCVTDISDSGDYMVVGACDTSKVTSFYSIKKGAAAPALVAVNPGTVTYDPTGKTLFAISSTGDGVAYDLVGVPVPGGGGGGAGGAGGAGGSGGSGGAATGPAGTLIDTGVGVPSTAYGAFPHYSADGATILYPTKDKRYRKSTVATPAPVDLTTGVSFVWTNHNDTHSWVSKSFDKSGIGDLYLVTDADGTTVPVSTDPKSALFTSAFSADNSTLLFWDQVTITVGVGQFKTAPLAAPATVVTRGNALGWDVVALEGTQVVYNDNYVGTPMMAAGVYGTTDIKLVDVATAGPETLVVSGGNAIFQVSQDKKYIVYNWQDPCGDAAISGVYAAKIPLSIPVRLSVPKPSVSIPDGFVVPSPRESLELGAGSSAQSARCHLN